MSRDHTEAEPDRLSAELIASFLGEDFDEFKLHLYGELVSTNDTAKEKAKADCKCGGHIYIAGKQTGGRGTQGRSFFSPTGGIYMSVILTPEGVMSDKAGIFTMGAAVAVCEAIEELTEKKPSIKWVNDILLAGRKIAGILTESSIDQDSGLFKWIVIGIGLNFSMPEQGFPEDIKEKAGALFASGQSEVTRNELIAGIIKKINEIFAPESIADAGNIMEKYRARLI